MSLLEIETARLRLRPLGTDDVERLHALWTDPDVRRYLWDGEVIPPEQTAAVVTVSAALFAACGYGLWAVCPLGGAELLGFGGFWHFHEPPEVQLLYGIAPGHWGRGLATEVARACIRYGFEELGLERVVASADAPNAASIRVMEKAGLAFERRDVVQGRDTVSYALPRERFRWDGSRYVIRRG